LLGRNGAGKTTLLRILAGLSPYQQGEVNLFGQAPRGGGARRTSGFLGHGIGVYEDLTATENLVFFARVHGIANVSRSVSRWLQRVGLDRVAKMPVRQFSRGMRQRLALARTFQHDPQVLLLDEPFTSLDDRAIAMLSELLAEARGRGATIVLSTHQLREALAIASDVALIENGKLRYSGPRTEEMLGDPALLYRLHTELGAD
jgi:heme ABC exporter ATP-binding subunit CcmA